MEVYATDVHGLQAKLHAAAPFSYLEFSASLQDHVPKICEKLLDPRVPTDVFDQDVRDDAVFLDKVHVCGIVQKPRSIPSQE